MKFLSVKNQEFTYHFCRKLGFAGLILAWGGTWALALPITGQVTVDPYIVYSTDTDYNGGLNAAQNNIASDAAYANAIWGQIGISFNFLPSTFIEVEQPLGGWTASSFNSDLNIAGNTDGNYANGVVSSFYVPSYPANGQTWSQEDVGVNDDATRPGIVMNGNTRQNDTFAHEMGHLLSNQYRWRRAESSTGGLGVHSGTATDLMQPNSSTPASLNALFPSDPNGVCQIRNNIGAAGQSSTLTNIRTPFITSSYFNSGVGGTTAGANMVKITARSTTSVGVGPDPGNISQSNNVPWGSNTVLTLAAPANTWSIDETARKIATNEEEFSFFYSSNGNTPLKYADGLSLSWGQIKDVQGPGYSGVAVGGVGTASVTVTEWDDILSPTATNAGAGLTLSYTQYYYHMMSGFSGELDITAGEGNVTNMRDFQVTFDLMLVPEPSAFWLATLGFGVLLISRRKQFPGSDSTPDT